MATTNGCYIHNQTNIIKLLFRSIQLDSLHSFALALASFAQHSDNFKYRTFLSCVNRMEGPHVDLVLYAGYLPLSTKADCEFYLEFIKATPKQVSEVIVLLRTGLEEGRTPPRVSMEGVSDSVRKTCVTNGGGGFLDPLNKIPKGEDFAALKAQITQVSEPRAKRAIHN